MTSARKRSSFIIFLIIASMGLLSAQLSSAAVKKMVKKPSAKPKVKLASTAKPDAEPIEFLFLPPDGTTYVESFKGTRITSVDGLKRIPETTEWKTRVTITRTTDGYHVVRTPISYSTSDIDEESMQAIISRCLRTAKIEYDLELTGYCSRVTGMDKVVEDVRAKVEKLEKNNGIIYDPEDSEDIDKEYADLLKSLTSSEEGTWSSRYMQLMGLYVKPGESMEEGHEMSIFYGLSSPGTIATEVLGTQKTGNHDCVKVQYTMHTNNDKPNKFTEQMLKMMFLSYTAVRSSYYGISRFSAAAKMECVVDPATLLLHSESSKSNSVVEIAFENDMKTSLAFDEYEQYTFEYEK
ncbi:MAG: hypothetical protein ABFD46_08470 [Armatimonadota bacterium]